MLVEMQIEILDGQSSSLFSNEPFEKRSEMTIEEFFFYSDQHFESHFLGKGCRSCFNVRLNLNLSKVDKSMG